MDALSSFALTTFEIANEIFISIGSGVFGLGVLLENFITGSNIFKTLLLSGITISSLWYAFKHAEVIKPSLDMVIFITGCDSGLGFSLAQHACEMGFTVLAGCLKLDSKGAVELRKLFGTKIHRVEIDITRSTSVQVALEVVNRFLKSDPNYKLWAVINNAGVMVFGEFEWLTEKLVQNQIDVNLLGTFRVTKTFCPLLRQHQGRLVVISSHCAQATLPGLAIYGATKSGLLGWCDGLRVELGKYGVKVISFIPGSFPQQSNIMARQVENCYEMHSDFTMEQKEFYGDYFKRYNSFLCILSGSKIVKKIEDPYMYDVFERVLLDGSPKAVYKNEPLRYKIYHFIFKYGPVGVRDYFITRFMNMPKYHGDSEHLMGGIS